MNIVSTSRCVHGTVVLPPNAEDSCVQCACLALTPVRATWLITGLSRRRQ